MKRWSGFLGRLPPRRGRGQLRLAAAALVLFPAVILVVLLVGLNSVDLEQRLTPAVAGRKVADVTTAGLVSASTAVPSPPIPPSASTPTVTDTTAPAPTPAPSPVPTRASVPMIAATRTPCPNPTDTPTAPKPTPATRPKLIALDPGHGGQYPGAAHRDRSGSYDVIEKNVNLRVALLLADMLREAGYRVILTRSTDTILNTSAEDVNGDGEVTVEDDLQARVDSINSSGADLLLSIHHNGSDSPSMRGCTTYYCADRPFAERNRALAEMVQAGLLAHLREAGYATVPDLGVRDDATIGKPHGHLCLTGPTTPVLARASQMPGVVGEALFVTCDDEAGLLKESRILQAIAAGYRDGVQRFFERYR